nr:hypothetical protein [Nocardia crassostreae]
MVEAFDFQADRRRAERRIRIEVPGNVAEYVAHPGEDGEHAGLVDDQAVVTLVPADSAIGEPEDRVPVQRAPRDIQGTGAFFIDPGADEIGGLGGDHEGWSGGDLIDLNRAGVVAEGAV